MFDIQQLMTFCLQGHSNFLHIIVVRFVVDGQVVVSIKIDRSGSVTEATPFSEESTITNEGVVAAVRSVALRAHFNANASAQALQSGTV